MGPTGHFSCNAFLVWWNRASDHGHLCPPLFRREPRRQALAGQESAFEFLVWRYQRKAFAVVRALGVEPGGVEDVVQEAFLHSARSLSALRDPGAFGPWFLAIVRNLARKHIERRASRRLVPVDDLDALPAPALETEEVGEVREELERELKRLPETLREAIFLYYYEGCSTRRVAKALGITSSTVRSRLKRGRDLLKERLWRRLEASIREGFPSMREWRRSAFGRGFLRLGNNIILHVAGSLFVISELHGKCSAALGHTA